MSLDIYIKRVNKRLDSYLPSKNILTPTMRYSVLSGGKRFRAILTYTVANAFNTNLDIVDSSACALELIHAYSLIHDDLPAMDDDDIRHNKEACHKKFGEAQAILAGDALQALAFKILVNDENIDIALRIKLLQELAYASFEMAEGQAIDLSVASKSVNIEILEKMHKKKTGALISCAVKIGIILTNNITIKDIEILTNFATNIGLAYQIQDDVLDETTTEDVLGKKQNSDKEKNKPTYVSLLGLEKSKKLYKDLYKKADAKLAFLSVDNKELQKLTYKLQTREF